MQISVRPATPEASVPRSGRLAYKWIVAIVVIFGIFMSILDSTIVNIAIPHLQSTFGADLNSVQWVLTFYTLAQGVATPLTAYLADRFGTKRLYILALILFTIGSALCGLAWSLPSLIFFRILQGAGGAFLSPLAITMLYREFPPNERGLAMGFLGVPLLMAPAFGPTIGGYIVTFIDWRFIFYINLPIGIIGVILASLLLREIVGNARLRFDLPGFIFSASGLASVLYALSEVSKDGWGSITVLGFLSVGLLLLAVFVVVEVSILKRGGQPLLDLSVFLNGAYLTSSIASVLVTFALFGGLFIIPVYLQSLRGQSAFQAGLILLPQAFASMVAMLVGGRLVDRFGVKPIVIPGLALLGVAMWGMTFVTLDTPFHSLQLLLILRSFALGLCMQPLTVSALSEMPPQRLPQASSMSTVLRFVSSSLGVAILATLVQTQTKIHYSHLAERVTATSPLGHMMTQLQAMFVAHGADLSQGWAGAAHVVIGLLQRQAYMLGIQDAYWATLGLTLVALVATFFVRARRQSAARPTPAAAPTPAQQEEAEAAREEALLAV